MNMGMSKVFLVPLLRFRSPEADTKSHPPRFEAPDRAGFNICTLTPHRLIRTCDPLSHELLFYRNDYTNVTRSQGQKKNFLLVSQTRISQTISNFPKPKTKICTYML